tara:strand:- start:210 stop:566 length:357 start_codon:yes stop_codon:yes gene_type:complete
MSLIEKFLKMATDDKLDINIEPLLKDKEDKAVFEKWLKIFTELEPVGVVPALEKISTTYIMTRRDEVVLLSYVKFFEQNILKMNKLMEDNIGLFDNLMKAGKKDNKKNKEDYNGSMFG